MEETPYRPPSANDVAVPVVREKAIPEVLGLLLYSGTIWGVAVSTYLMADAFSAMSSPDPGGAHAFSSAVSGALIPIIIGTGLGVIGLAFVVTCLLLTRPRGEVVSLFWSDRFHDVDFLSFSNWPFCRARRCNHLSP